MALIVQKFGGSSVADPTCIRRVASRVAESYDAGNDMVVVVSAMGDTTDHLIALAKERKLTPTLPKGKWICFFPPANSRRYPFYL